VRIRHEDIEALAEDVTVSLELRALASEWADRLAALTVECNTEVAACHCLIRVLIDVGFHRPGDITALRHGLSPELAETLDQILSELPEAS
jgi:hypothetical protein